MAPILATATGVPAQELCKPLQSLFDGLKRSHATEDVTSLLDVLNGACGSGYIFHEQQVDLYHWIEPLNFMDKVVQECLAAFPVLLLRKPNDSGTSDEPGHGVATNLQEVESVPETIWKRLDSILRFWGLLLRNSISKPIFNSVSECVDLLCAARDDTADAALAVLEALCLPPALHKLQAPDVPPSPALPASAALAHSRLTLLSRGYGSRASGVGLLQLVTTDDSVYNKLPAVGRVNFSYFDEELGRACSVDLGEDEILQDGVRHGENRRRVQSKSTAELFFMGLEKLSVSHQNPKSDSENATKRLLQSDHSDRLFRLLADIRLARDFHSRNGRRAAVERRLRALVSILHAHPSQEILSGYFQACPEIAVEIVDLLRPTVSCSQIVGTSALSATHRDDTVSSQLPTADDEPTMALQRDGIAGLGDSHGGVPYGLRLLSVEALTALVARRDGSTSALIGGSRLSAVLVELGVGKGQYLGLLPTLIRYSLASLRAAASQEKSENGHLSSTSGRNESLGMDVGLAFAQAASAPQATRRTQVVQALYMIDSILTLCSAVVASPSGSSALTDCGLIPALLTTVGLETDKVCTGLTAGTTWSETERAELENGGVKSLLRYVTAQSVQVLEQAVVTNSHALTGFHDLNGVRTLTQRLGQELPPAAVANDDDVRMVDTTMDTEDGFLPSRSVLLYSIVTCLTVIFHQDASSTSNTANITGSQVGGEQLRKPELTLALLHVLENSNEYGGHLVSLIATLLSDVMNSDPHIVHYVHQSGIANAFLNMVLGEAASTPSGEPSRCPILPPVPELVMAIPNVLTALALTDDGASVILELNPFPSFLSIFYHPRYCMPRSKCLLNEMTAIVGTGLDEIMRHVHRLRPLVLQAITAAMQSVIHLAQELHERELEAADDSHDDTGLLHRLEEDRTCLIQYVLNFGQLLEQILHNEEHTEPFCAAGGLDALLLLYPVTQVTGRQFLTHLSCLSCPSVSTLHHSTIEESLNVAVKCIQFRYAPKRLLEKIVAATKKSLNEVGTSMVEVFGSTPSAELTFDFELDKVSSKPVFNLPNSSAIKTLSLFLNHVSTLQWMTGLLATSLKAVVQRSQESGAAEASEWKQILTNAEFSDLMRGLTSFYRSSLFEVCRLRTSKKFESGEQERWTSKSARLSFRLRIVCPEGAVVRNGIEIDSCQNVGSMEMGEVVVADERCINSSGILRYRTKRGWVSEMTRGHGREPIAEVLHIVEASEAARSRDDMEIDSHQSKVDRTDRGRREAGVPSLQTATVGVLARGQSCFAELLCAVSRLSVHFVRSMQLRDNAAAAGGGDAGVAETSQILSSVVSSFLSHHEVLNLVDLRARPHSRPGEDQLSGPAIVTYLGGSLNYIQACLFDDKRERKTVNLPLLVSLASADSCVERQLRAGEGPQADETMEKFGVFDACSLMLKEGLGDMEQMFKSLHDTDAEARSAVAPVQRVSHSNAASFPALITLLRRMVCNPLVSSPAASVMSRVKWKDVPRLLCIDAVKFPFSRRFDSSGNDFFEPESFVGCLQLTVSRAVRDAFVDSRLAYAPPHLLHPILSLVADILVALENTGTKKQAVAPAASHGETSYNLSDYFRRRRQAVENGQDDSRVASEPRAFQPDESTISQLAEMGFDRDRALDAIERTRSNRVEVVMEYALTHPPPSPGAIERLRTQREEREAARAAANARDSTDRLPEHAASSGGDNPSNQGGASADATASSDSPQQAPAQEDNPPLPVDARNEYSAAQAEVSEWIDQSPRVCVALLGGINTNDISDSSDVEHVGPLNRASSACNGDGELEAVTVVVCAFLLDLCHRYPSKRSSIVKQILVGLRGQLDIALTADLSHVPLNPRVERSVTSLCHATVLLIRALPKSRAFVLQNGVVGTVVRGIRLFTTEQVDPIWPMWLSPGLLLLDIMAQPVVGFAEEVKEADTDERDAEFIKVKEEHVRQSRDLADLARTLFSDVLSVRAHKAEGSLTPHSPANSTNPGTVDSRSDEGGLATIPAFYPLLPLELAEQCLSICLAILGVTMTGDAYVSPPAGVAHATLLLLLRLLRSPTIAAKCRKLGVAEAVLALPAEVKFTGNTGLVAIIFRRLLEDEATLRSAMETEMRCAVSKLQTKLDNPGSPKRTVSLHEFMEAVTPLLCRDPLSFLQAMFLSVKVEPGLQTAGATVHVLAPSEREERLASTRATSWKGLLSEDASPSEKADDALAKKNRGKSPHKSAKKSSQRKIRKSIVPSRGNQSSLSCETSAVHVTSLLMNSIMVAATQEHTSSESAEFKSFLWIGSRLEILADLIISVPACASAVHNFRHNRAKDKVVRAALSSHIHHAMPGCPKPSRSFVNFLLHSLLPQDRWSIRNDIDVWDRKKGLHFESAGVAEKRKNACRVTKASQAAARVILALVSRPGDGRKRLIGDVAFALSGGRIGHGNLDCKERESEFTRFCGRELHALHAWGEICLAIAAPRSTGRSFEGLATLSVENCRLMLEQGMVHALLYATHRVELFHPMASSVFGSLLLPLECLSRSSVAEAVFRHAEKEAARQSCNKQGTANAECGDPAEQAEVDQPETPCEVADGTIEAEGLADAEQGGVEEGDENVDVDMDDSNPDESEDEGATAGRASQLGDLSSGAESDSDVEESDSEDDDDGSSTLDNSQDDPSQEVEDGDWHEESNEHDRADIPEDHQGFEGWEEDGTDQVEQALQEGWTRIESAGFGGMLLGGGRRVMTTGSNGDRPSRSRGFIGAAEAMIGSLLRNGEISSETLAEIEGSLGIRIMGNGRSIHSLGGDPQGGAGFRDSFAVRVLGVDNGQSEQRRHSEVVGTLPHIHQRGQPDAGHSAFGSGARWADISSMEFVFGGPALTAGNRNFDLISPLDHPANNEIEAHAQLSQLDLQLFPGGSAAASVVRAQYALHPLLCGIDLPPVNALVTDLLPHGDRATRPGQMTTRRPGDWTNASFAPGGYLVSTSNGNIVRASRPNSSSPLGGGIAARHIAGPVGWTDDGLPVDATVEVFSSAIERALAETLLSSRPVHSTNNVSANASSQPVPATDDGSAPVHVSAQAETTQVVRDAEAPAEESSGRQDNVRHGDNEQESQPEAMPLSEGDNVASSLAASLRLSPGSDGVGSEGLSSGHSPFEEATDLEAEAAAAGGEAEHPEFAEGIADNTGEEAAGAEAAETTQTRGPGLQCPPDVDPEVFRSLPEEMQRDCVNQYNATREIAAQLDGSTLDPEVLAALPEDMRREVMEQDRRERQMREQSEAPADPSNAEEMDNASFVASLSPELREEILLTADEAFLNSLPPGIVAEAQILRERATTHQRRLYDEEATSDDNHAGVAATSMPQVGPQTQTESGVVSPARKRPRYGKLRVESDREHITYIPKATPAPVAASDLFGLIRLTYLLAPVRPSRLVQKVLQNFSSNPWLRSIISITMIQLLHGNAEKARTVVRSLSEHYSATDDWRRAMDKAFPVEPFPSSLLGAVPDIPNPDAVNSTVSGSLLRRKQGIGSAASMAASLPQRGSAGSGNYPPLVVASRIVEVLLQLCKSSPRFSLHALVASAATIDGEEERSISCFDFLLDLLEKPLYFRSSANLDHLLSLLEAVVAPLSQVPRYPEHAVEVPKKDVDAAAASGKEWVEVPRVVVSRPRLQVLCSILRMETCRDTSFSKANTIIRRLCRIETNRGYVLAELASVAHGLGQDALQDLKALKVRMDRAASHRVERSTPSVDCDKDAATDPRLVPGQAGHTSSSVTLSTSSSELKLLRVLQTLQALCSERWDEATGKRGESNIFVTGELVHLLRQLEFDDLWNEVSSCLRLVQVLEGVKVLEEEDADDGDNVDDASGDASGKKGKKLRNSAAGLLTRFLPAIEALFVANASAVRPREENTTDALPGKTGDIPLNDLVGGELLMQFVDSNKLLLNALVHANPSLLDKGLRALVQVPRCRVFLDFDVKRQWFKTQVRRLRQQASRRHGSLRLHIRRKNVFEDAYHQLRLRNADEMRGRLHITFRNEEGVDAGGLSREFFGILAKEMFNPNYALFTSTEDGCTFQPNPNSSINPDHLSYFRFVGRIVGKAVADGFLLDAHFTRSLYKHMLGVEPTHHDMEAIDPDYYRNLKTILEFNLADIGLELTFSIEDHSFGRNQTIDLITNGRSVSVTEANKEEYVRLVCHYRMTSAIQSQIKAYLDGFYEMVAPDLITIFTPRELELLVSGLPDIDVHDLKNNTEYVGWKSTDREIEWFWNVLFSLGRSEKASFLQFVTGSSKVPLSGFRELQGMRGTQKFSIHKVATKAGSLMSAHTCFNSLDLPSYNSQEELRGKLLYAINEGGGAFLFA